MKGKGVGKKKDRRKQQFLIALLLFAVMTGILAGYVAYNELSGGRNSVYTFTNVEGREKHDSLTLSLEKGETWTDYSAYPEQPYGAQYDFSISSDSRRQFQGWMVEIVFSEPPVIDSSWNGEFKSGGNRIYYLPANNAAMDLTTIFPGTIRTFGAIIYTKNHTDVEEVIVTGHWYTPIFQQRTFWILAAVWFILAFVAVQNLLLWRRTEFYNRQLEKDDEMIRQSMLTLTDFIDAKDSYTRGHSSRVAIYSTRLAERLGMGEAARKDLYYTALMHDCGKVGVPDAVLKKPGRLTDDEFRLIQAHATVGSHLLEHFTTIPNISDGAHYHHERYDGTGYPEGLSGERIPYISRIICIADAVDAMSTNRCYRDRLPLEHIISELIDNSGIQFDPKMVPPMITLLREGMIDEVQRLYPNKA